LPLQKAVKSADKDLDEQMVFEEFVNYLQDHEKDLRLVFKSLDRRRAGMQLSTNQLFGDIP
jgi:solute carrier family 25 phosphate transporter 23/24/25/41